MQICKIVQLNRNAGTGVVAQFGAWIVRTPTAA